MASPPVWTSFTLVLVLMVGTDHGCRVKQKTDEDAGPYLAIQLGHSHSHVGYWSAESDSALIVEDTTGSHAIPNVMCADGIQLMQDAVLKRTIDQIPRNIDSMNGNEKPFLRIDDIMDIKSLIGISVGKDKHVDKERYDRVEKLVPFNTFWFYRVYIPIQINDTDVHLYTPEQVLSVLIKCMKNEVEKKVKTDIKGGVMSVPADFDDTQRRAVKDAAIWAGITGGFRIINEPNAALLGLEADKREGEYYYLVTNLERRGGQIAFMIVDSGVFEVVGSWSFSLHPQSPEFTQELKLVTNIQNALTEMRREKAETVSWMNSSPQTSFPPPVMGYPVLTGDVAVVQKYKDIILRYFSEQEQSDNQFDTEVEPADERIIHGLVKMAKYMQNDDESDIYYLCGDVLPLTIGLEARGGIMVPMLKRNTRIPTLKNLTFITQAHNQTKVSLRIYQGEHLFVKNNLFIQEVTFDGLAHAVNKTRVNISMEVDVNGQLIVRLMEEHSGLKMEHKIDCDIFNDVFNDSTTRCTEIEQHLEHAENTRQKEEQMKEKIIKIHYVEDYLRGLKMWMDHPWLPSQMSEEEQLVVANILDISTTFHHIPYPNLDKFEESEALLEKIKTTVNPVISSLYQRYKNDWSHCAGSKCHDL